MTWQEVWRQATAALADAAVDDPAGEARWMVEEASGNEGAEWVAGLSRAVPQRQLAHLDAMVARRTAGEPLAYVLGRWAFRTLDLLVDRRVLIPRPETEVVAGLALDELRRLEAPGRAPRALDLGTGTGAIGLSLAAEHRSVEVVVTDASPEALAVARSNLAGLGRPSARVRVAAGDWYAALAPDEGPFDVVVANPPYVADGEQLADAVARWEPASALRGGPDGLDDIRTIVAGAPAVLRRSGALVVELAPAQASDVAGLARQAGFTEAIVADDQYGQARALVARR